PGALQTAADLQQDRRRGQRNLFEAFDGAAPEAAPAADLPDVGEWPAAEKLKYEKEALDFYFSSHPLAQHESVLKLFSTHRVGQLAELGAGQEGLVGGMLTQVRYLNTKKARNGNSRYVRFKLEDFDGAAECVMWPDDLVRYKDAVAEDRICFLAASVERAREEPSLVVTRVLDLEQVQRERTTGLVLDLTLDADPNLIDAVARVLQRTPGSCPVFLHVRDGSGRRALLKAGDAFRVNPWRLSRDELETLLGPGRAQFSRPGYGRNGG